MELKEKEFFEYMKCPLRYQFIKNNVDIGEDRTFKKLCYQAINHYFAARTNGMKADMSTLKKKWDNLCIQNQDLLTPKKALDGWGMLFRTCQYIENNNINFMDINTPYVLEIPETQLSIKGQLDPIIDKGDYIEIFIVSFEKVIPDRIKIDTKLKHTIDAYAIKEMFKKDVVINYYTPAQGVCIQTLRANRDYDRLESIVKNVGKAIINDSIYPRENVLCSSCLARDICKSWTGKDGGEDNG